MSEQNTQNTGPIEGKTVLAVGSLASAARTITGVQSQAEWFGVDTKGLQAILRRVGLPERAFDEPTFLISIDQELVLIEALLAAAHLNASLSAFVFGQRDLHDITLFGAPGLAMRHAPDLLSLLKVGLDFPQLLWGHSRMRIVTSPIALSITFSIDWRTTAQDALVEYGLLLDLVSYYTFVNQSMGRQAQVSAIHLPFAEPHDADIVRSLVDCPVHFGAEAAEILLPPECAAMVPLRSRPLIYQQSIAVCRELAHLRPFETTLSDQALRWLWAYSPPLPRTALAKQLGMSERSLARRLRAEGTSFQKLFAEVQSERARNLLRTSNQSIAEISYQLGYADPAAFTRAFTGWTGKTPSAWRAR
ncbi:MAG: helix-turn-helix domain-containing protein [Alphaproteobacteria bacterium]